MHKIKFFKGGTITVNTPDESGIEGNARFKMDAVIADGYNTSINFVDK